MCVLFLFFHFVVVMRDLVHYVETVFLLPLPLTATFFDLHVQCRIVLKFIFCVFVVLFFFALWLLYVS